MQVKLKGYISDHNHSDFSNGRLLDSTDKIADMLKEAVELGYKGMALTDHETVSGHVKAIQAVRKMKENGSMPKDFKLILGNEIYLVDSLEEVRDDYKGGGITKFPHFLILAKDEIDLIGKNSKTLKIKHKDIEYIKFRFDEDEFEKLFGDDGTYIINLIGRCGMNEWQGVKTPQVIIEDFEVEKKNTGKNVDWADLF